MWVDHQATPIGWVNQQLTWLQFGCVGQATVLQHLQGCGCPLVDGHLAVIHQLLQLLDPRKRHGFGTWGFDCQSQFLECCVEGMWQLGACGPTMELMFVFFLCFSFCVLVQNNISLTTSTSVHNALSMCCCTTCMTTLAALPMAVPKACTGCVYKPALGFPCSLHWLWLLACIGCAY